MAREKEHSMALYAMDSECREDGKTIALIRLVQEAAMTEERETYTPEPWSVLRDPFVRAMAVELCAAEQRHAPLHSVHEAYAVILEELDELWEEVRKKREARSAARVRAELVQIAAMAWRAARDLGMQEEHPGEGEC